MTKYRPNDPAGACGSIPDNTEIIFHQGFCSFFSPKTYRFFYTRSHIARILPLYSGAEFLASDLSYFPCTHIKTGTMLKQVQTQKQQHTILPQQIELLNLFHLNTLELEQRIQDELSENPALEELSSGDEATSDKFSKETVQDFQNWEEYGYDDIPDYKTEYNNYINTEKVPEKPIAEVTDFREDLKRQCRFLDIPEDKLPMLDFLIDSLNENGFLEQDLDELASEISFKRKIWIEPEELEGSLKLIRELEPDGRGLPERPGIYVPPAEEHEHQTPRRPHRHPIAGGPFPGPSYLQPG